MPEIAGGFLQSAAAATGNGTPISIQNLSSFVFTVSGIFVGTVVFEGSEDGVNWSTLEASALGSTAAPVTSATAPGLFEVQVAGLQLVRSRVSAYTSGAITVSGHGGTSSFVQPGGASGGGGGGGAVTAASGAFASGSIAAGALVDGADVTQGTTTDASTANTVIGRLKKLISLLPTALGALTSANSLSVTLASDQVAVATTSTDGAFVTLGAKGDAAASSGSVTLMALTKSMAANLALPLAVKPNSLEVTASITGTGTAFTQDAQGYRSLSVQTAGTFSLSTIFEESDDNTNWSAVPMLAVGATGALAPVTTPSSVTPTMYHGPILGRYVRFRCSAYTSGTMNVTAEFSSLPLDTIVGAMLSQLTGTGLVQVVPATSGGNSALHFVAAASNNAQNVKASVGQLYNVDIINVAAYPVYVKLYDTAGSPTPGTTPIKKVIGVPASSSKSFNSSNGLAFAAGIAVAVLKDITDAGTTAVALSDCSVDIEFK